MNDSKKHQISNWTSFFGQLLGNGVGLTSWSWVPSLVLGCPSCTELELSCPTPRGKEQEEENIRSLFGSSYSLFERALCFSCVTNISGFVLSNCLQHIFVVFPSVLMARVGDGSDVPISLLPVSFSNFGSPDGSCPDLEKVGKRNLRPCLPKDLPNSDLIIS